jgi:hypothetical protein
MPGEVAAAVFLVHWQDRRLSVRSDRCSSERHSPLSNRRFPRLTPDRADCPNIISRKVEIWPRCLLSTRIPVPAKCGGTKALTCLKCREHFIDPAVYLAGASRWIT